MAGKPGEPWLDSPKDIFIFHRRLINKIIGREELNELTENYNRLDIVVGYCLVSNSESPLHITTRITGCFVFPHEISSAHFRFAW